jgi:SAM-dependent methyltransferase
MSDAASMRRIRHLYSLFDARWYDPFRALWERLTSRAAEDELDRLVRESAAEGFRVLDIGCGTGHNLGRLRRLGVHFESYRGIDLPHQLDARHRPAALCGRGPRDVRGIRRA